MGSLQVGIPTNSRKGSGTLHRTLSPGDAFVLSLQVLPLEALVTDAGEVTEIGKTYVPPRVLQEALCVISGVPGLKGDITSTEQLAQEMLVIAHHPSLGLWLWGRSGRAGEVIVQAEGFKKPLSFSGSTVWTLASTSYQDED